MSKRLLPRSLGSEATAALRDLILNGHFRPGAHVVESDLATHLGISNGTVRVALQALQHEGLLEHRPHRGVFVKRLNLEDAWEVYSLRGTLEAMAAKLATKRITETERQELRNIFSHMVDAEQSGDRSRKISACSEFHRHIVRLSGHRLLDEHYRLLESKIRLMAFLVEESHEDGQHIISSHGPILEAILDGDAERVESLVIEHNAAAIENLITYIKSLEAQNGGAFSNSDDTCQEIGAVAGDD